MISNKNTFRNPLYCNCSIGLGDIKICTRSRIGGTYTNERTVFLNNSTILISCEKIIDQY